jgi:hypothetical protein
MALNPTTHTPEQIQSLQRHHQQACEHLQKAVTCHAAAAKLHSVGDHNAAEVQAKSASDHTRQAVQQALLAEKIATHESPHVVWKPSGLSHTPVKN